MRLIALRPRVASDAQASFLYYTKGGRCLTESETPYVHESDVYQQAIADRATAKGYLCSAYTNHNAKPNANAGTLRLTSVFRLVGVKATCSSRSELQLVLVAYLTGTGSCSGFRVIPCLALVYGLRLQDSGPTYEKICQFPHP